MPRPHGDTTAAVLLGAWTDSDTAMQIVGTSLGIFGADLLDPELALSSETPLRNALFDVLLSLVEGGALDMRPTDDGLYAFRWRPDYAVAGLSPETSISIDLDAPSPYMVELMQMRRERDEALGRAHFAEALAQEREQLMRLADVPVPVPGSNNRAPGKVRDALDEREQSILDVLYASRGPNAQPAAEEIDLSEGATIDLVSIEVESIEIEAVAAPRATKPRAKAVKPKAAPAKATKPKVAAAAKTKTPAATTATAAKPASKPKAAATKATKPRATKTKVKAEPPESSDVVYLTPPVPEAPTDDTVDELEHDQIDDEPKPRRAKWSGYTLDKPRMHLSSVDRIADEG